MESVACKVTVSEELAEKLGWVSFHGFAAEFEQLNQFYCRNWLLVAAQEPQSSEDESLKHAIAEHVKVEDFEISQLPD